MYNEFNVFGQGNSYLDFQYPLLDQSLFPSPEQLGGLPSGLLGVEKLEIPSLTPTSLAPSFAIHSNFSGLHPLVDPLRGTSPAVNTEAINLALLQVGQSFDDFLQKPNYIDSLQVAFGSGWQAETATTLIKDLAQGQNLPAIEVVTGEELQAQGAFSQQTNTIYLAQEFVEQNPTNEIATVLTEELGHYIDSQLNPVDTPGDEGELFAAIVNGVELTPERLQAIKAEDDHNIVTINGQTLLIEQSVNEIIGTAGRDVLTGTPLSDRIIGGFGADIITGGLGADIFVYQSIRDAGDTIKDFELRLDVIDLSQVLNGFGYQGLNPIADGYIKFSTYTGGTIILIDSDGTGSLSARPYIYVENVTPNDLSSYPSHFIPNPGKLPQIQANLANDTGVSDSDRLTQDPTVSGQITDATTLQGNLNGNGFVDISDALNEDGSFTISLEQYDVLSNGVLPDGEYTLELKASSSTGQASEIVTVSFTLDLTPPPVTFGLAPESDTGILGDRMTSDRFVALVGQTEPGLTVALLENQQMLTADSQGNFSFTNVPMPVAGQAPFTIVAVDAAGNQGRVQQFFTREGINGAPEITSIPESIFDTTQQTAYTYQIEATDPDGDDLTYTLLNAPLGTEIDENQVLSFTPSADLKPFYEFTVEVSDGRGGTDIQTFTVEVPAFANFGTIRGIKWNDLNGNGVRDNELVQGSNPDVVYVLDVSGSADFGFVGSPIGDFNGDGLENTRLDAEIAAFIALNQQLNSQELGDRAQVAIVVYSGFAANADMDLGTNGLQITTTLGADSNSDGTTDVEEILRSIRSGAFGVGNFTGTNPEIALQKVEETFASIGTQAGNGNVIFLTDGEQNRGGSIVDEVERLKAQGFNLSAFGVGNDASLSVIQTIDPDGTKFTSIDDILDAFGGIGEGSRSVLEPGLAGVSIYLDINNNGILDPGEPVQITAQDDPSTLDIDETGQYEFNNLAPGTYIVREIIPDGFEQTFPLRNVTRTGDGYADIILEFVSGGNAPSPLIEPYGSTGGLPSGSPFNGNGRYTVEPVNPEVILGAPPPSPIIGRNPEVDWLALPLGSYVTVGFTDEVIIDGPGDDIFIRSFDPIDSANEFADVFVSSNGIDFELLGTINQRGLVSLDLADINFTKPVIAVRVQGLDNRGTSPGFDLISVEVLPGSIASPDFYTVQLEAGEIVENIDFGNVQIAINQDPIITSTPIIEAVVGQPYEYLVRANDPDGDPLTFSLNQAPQGMVIDPQTGRISYTPPITAITSNFDTSDSQIRPGIDNQASFTDDNQGINFGSSIGDYAVGEGFRTFSNLPVGPLFRSAVSFDLSSLSSQVTSAKLQLQKNRTSGDPIETLGLFEVTTDANTLYTSSYVSPAIYEDLGTGRSYGTFDVATGGNTSEILEFELNEAAIAAINAASGDFFSIGLALLSANPNNTTQAAEYLFAFSGNAGIQRLVLETENKETVEILVNDGKGGEAVQNYTLNIVESSDNQPPVITSTPTISIALGETYEYQIEATDPNADSLTYSLINFPDGMEIDEFGKITWIPTEIGEFTLEIAVSDGRGGADTQIYRVEVVRDLAEDTEAPQINFGFNSTVLKLGETLDLQIQGLDNVGLADLDVSFNGDSLVLTPDTVTNGLINTASITPNTTGVFEVVATATDFAGNTVTETISVRVINPNDTQAPITELDLSGFDPLNPVISELTDIVGTINDPDLEFYRVELAPVSLINLSNPAANDPDYITIAEGRANVDNGVLAQIDPNLYRNDSYYIRVYTQDYSGNANVQGVVLGINSQNKPGRFALEFTDLSIPLTGIPIEIQRRYDSLDAKFSGDFGYGWSLGLQDAQIQEAAPTGIDLSRDNFFGGNSFTVGTRVTLTTPDGRRVGFTFNPVPDFAGFLGVRYKPTFTPDAGVYDRLEVDYTPLSVRSDGSVGLYLFGFTYNPSQYRLITKEGITYRYDQYKGLLDVTDRNGNKLTYTDAGIFSSTGQSVNFNRDAQGRITEIIDPAGKGIIYNYDAQGNLVSVSDRNNSTTQFVYDTQLPSYLTEIIDPLGRKGVRTEYDEQGRLARIIDGNGNVTNLGFDTNASVQTITDGLGNKTTLIYDSRGNIISEINALGGVTQRTYDTNNNLLSLKDPLGNTATYTYDSRGNLLTQTNPLNQTTTYTYNDLNKVVTVTDPLGNTTQNTYDSQGNLVSQRDAAGNITTYVYDARGNVTTVTSPQSQTTKYEYDSQGRITGIIDALNQKTGMTYDGNGNLLNITTPLGNTTRFTYDAEGRPISVTDALGNVSRIEYNALGDRTATIDALGRRREFSYDTQGQLTENRYPDGTTERFTYDANGRRTSYTDRGGRTTIFVYDGLGRLFETIAPDGTPDNLTDNPRIRREYDAAGRLIGFIDERGNRTEYGYDAADRQILVRDALNNPTRYAYDADVQVVTITDALNRATQFVYDPLGRVVETRYPDGTKTITTYDALDRVIAETDQAGITTQFEYDALDRLTAVVDALGQRTEYGYDAEGNLISQKDAKGNTTTYQYDAVSQRFATILPLGQRSTQTYDAVGNVTSVTDFNGKTITYRYNSNDQIITEGFADGTSVNYTYTPTLQRATVTDSRGVTSYTYNERDQLTTRTEVDGRTIGYTYDIAGNRTSLTTPAGTVGYTYDALNRMQTVSDRSGGVTRYVYDAVGNLVRTELPNNTVETRRYDSLDRLVSVEQRGASGIIAGYEYTLGLAGNRLAVTEANGRQVNYAYDRLYRLVQEAISDPTAGNRTIGYTYDAVGNRLSRNDSGEGLTTYSYDDNDRLLREILNGQTTEYTYDDNGSTLTVKVNGTDQVNYRWDDQGRLISADIVTPQGTQRIEYRYDADGNRVAVIVNGEETRYLVDTEEAYAEVVEEYKPDGTIEKSYVRGLDLISQDQQGQASIHHAAGLGSVNALTDSNGNVTDRYIYDAFGRLIGQQGNTDNDFGFTGEQFDENSDLYYLRARYYNPENGQFISKDSFEGFLDDPQSLHKYTYVHNNPVNLIDPSGNVAAAEYRLLIQRVAPVVALATLRIALRQALINIAKGLADIPTTPGPQRPIPPFTPPAPPPPLPPFTPPAPPPPLPPFTPPAPPPPLPPFTPPAPPPPLPPFAPPSPFPASPPIFENRRFGSPPDDIKDTLPAFPGTKRAKSKTPVQGGGGKRERWLDGKGKIYEWDSKKGTVEIYDPRGKNHLGDFDPRTGTRVGPKVPSRKVEP
ncbi:colicin E3/pyocin S6 family cytotoxin [Nostoc sp. UHCC 0870]|uniref:colicin E3/pyocin S6 family cytotoxin n=1 Tax=Nostoc sp. UHCC 0870 TaxID=2914041 RepID=UPI001EE12522|nr:colicin E3/pyocin S6 family cytotoxin [Nostoc sp. UHCC 0870]UKP00954.1 colicin E3/pyocin S6 family cytotoxin [Nostoc sp. UHCC 0870]